MESHGIRVDIEGCKIARQKLETKIRQLEERAHELAGVLFSLSVPAEVASVLYTHLKLPVPIGCNKGKQHPTTDKQALDALMYGCLFLSIVLDGVCAVPFVYWLYFHFEGANIQ
jgi:DNA polymerase theta